MTIPKMPKFKPTPWKISFCTKCSKLVTYGCRQNHNVVVLDNIPFFVPDMQIVSKSGQKGWVVLESKVLKQEFRMHPFYLIDIAMSCGIKSRGIIANNWWMWTKKFSGMSIRCVV